MLAVVRVARGVVEVNYMWLPSWIGLNTQLLADVGKHMQGKAQGKVLNEDTMKALHMEVVEYLCARFPTVEGLYEYLNGLRAVSPTEPRTGAFVG